MLTSRTRFVSSSSISLANTELSRSSMLSKKEDDNFDIDKYCIGHCITIYSYLIDYCSISVIFDKEKSGLGKRKSNQISDEQLTKQLFYHSHPE